MELEGQRRISASRDRVWQALNDPNILAAAIPGCESLEKVSDNELIATVRVTVGPVRARFKGQVTLSNVNPPSSYTIAGEGQGGAAGFAKGKANVELKEAPEGTELVYKVEALVGGKLAQVGSRLIEGTARKLSDQFFDAFSQQVTGAAAVPEAAIAAAMPGAEAAGEIGEPLEGEAETGGRGGLPMYIWVASLILLVIIILAVLQS